MRALAWVAAGVASALCLVAMACLSWLLMGAGASPTEQCSKTGNLDRTVPARLVPIFAAASRSYDLGTRGPSILAGLTSIESDFGRNQGPSSAGAVGWTQFLPATWRAFGVDADGDGRADPGSPHDAIHAAARYLRHLGAPGDWRKALFGYNHSQQYVDDVLARARNLAAPGQATSCNPILLPAGDLGRITGGGQIVPIPGQPGELVDRRILPDTLLLIRRYRLRITDGYATSGHAVDGEHPLGLALDIVPGPDGTWDDVDRLARWAEPRKSRPRPPFRWVGYTGDPNHGRGHHLHLSWTHGVAPGNRPPAPWVDVLLKP